MAAGPLAGLHVLEMQALGPAPFAGMVLSDLGADVVQIARVGESRVGPAHRYDLMNRGRRSLGLDLRSPGGADVLLRLVERSDALLEGFRPGVMERLGVGPDVCLARNPTLVYGRMTGWGQTGPYAHAPGHDINYIARNGVLHTIGRQGAPPTPPQSLVGDFGGGAMFLVVGVLAALWERRSSGRGQVVDAAIIDGSSLLNTFMYGMLEEGTWLPERGSNVSDSGSPFYDVYATADGQYMAVGAIEPKFWSELVHALALPSEWLGWQGDRGRWAEMKATMRDLFRTRTRAEWTAELVDLEACVSPVMAPAEAPADPQVAGRHGFVTVDGILQPAPAPRFDRTPGVVAGAPPEPGAHSTEVLSEAGFSDVEVKGLIASGAVRPAC